MSTPPDHQLTPPGGWHPAPASRIPPLALRGAGLRGAMVARALARGDTRARLLMSVPGVGAVVVLAYMTGVEDPVRFRRSSSVAAYFGMTPARYQSGEVDRAGRVSKCGDSMVRGLLFEAAKVLLSRLARPCALQTWGRALAERIGGKKATMAVARKLAVLLHRMWSSNTTFRWPTGALAA